MLTDENGKELDALTVYSLSIEYLKGDFYDHLNNCSIGNLRTSDIHWVLTVPDIISEPAKQLMKIKAQEVLHKREMYIHVNAFCLQIGFKIYTFKLSSKTTICVAGRNRHEPSELCIGI